jgi:trigger factor
VQVEFTQINSAKKEILLTVEADRVNNAYRKYLLKSAGEVSIPGFRKGKAPIHMVERTYGEKIRDYFYKDYIDEVFTEATKEYDIHFLLYPEIQDVNWEPGNEMTIKVEIEVEPEVSFTQIEGLKVPYKPLLLNDEVEHYIEELRKENSTMIEVDDGIKDNDEVEFEVKCSIEGKEYTQNYTTMLNREHELDLTVASVDKKIGMTFSLDLPHAYIHHIFKDAEHSHHEENVEATFMVNAIRRRQLPVIDDEFAKDLEFESVQDMKDKITAELKEKNELKNNNIKINALITKLYVDNRFDLPEKTIQYLAEKELEQYNITDEKWLKYYEYQIRYQITQDFVNMYLMRALRKQYTIELNEEDFAQYYEHEAKLSDQSVEEWKEKHKQTIDGEDFKETVTNYMILNNIANTCDYYIPEEDPIVTEDAEVVTSKDKKPRKSKKETQNPEE